MFFEIWKSEFMKKMDTDIVKRLERKKTRKAQGRRKVAPKTKIVTHVVNIMSIYVIEIYRVSVILKPQKLVKYFHA